jgi:uncharacterized Tic20 family protein
MTLPESAKPNLTIDERLLAGIAHGSILVFGWGILAPVLVYFTQRDRSRYVAFQALQAIAYQILFMVAYWLLTILTFILMGFLQIFGIAAAAVLESDVLVSLANLSPLLAMLALIGFMGFLWLLGLAGGVACLFGAGFKYPLLGGWLERYLQPRAAKPVSVEVAHV